MVERTAALYTLRTEPLQIVRDVVDGMLAAMSRASVGEDEVRKWSHDLRLAAGVLDRKVLPLPAIPRPEVICRLSVAQAQQLCSLAIAGWYTDPKASQAAIDQLRKALLEAGERVVE